MTKFNFKTIILVIILVLTSFIAYQLLDVKNKITHKKNQMILDYIKENYDSIENKQTKSLNDVIYDKYGILLIGYLNDKNNIVNKRLTEKRKTFNGFDLNLINLQNILKIDTGDKLYQYFGIDGNKLIVLYSKDKRSFYKIGQNSLLPLTNVKQYIDAYKNIFPEGNFSEYLWFNVGSNELKFLNSKKTIQIEFGYTDIAIPFDLRDIQDVPVPDAIINSALEHIKANPEKLTTVSIQNFATLPPVYRDADNICPTICPLQ